MEYDVGLRCSAREVGALNWDEEEWRDIPGWEGRYQASTTGRIRSLGRFIGTTGRKGRRFIPQRILRLQTKGMYRAANLKHEGAFRQEYVHRLVCLTFHGAAPSRKNYVAHSDHDKHNNAAANLRWASAGENMADSVRDQRMALGERQHLSRLTEQTVRELRTRYAAGETITDLRREYMVAYSTIQRAISKETWKHVT